MDGIRVFSPSSVRPDTITNVVYRELLDQVYTTPEPLPIAIRQPQERINTDETESDSSYDDYF
jgi:hypothetical protein